MGKKTERDDMERYKTKLLMLLTQHVGEANSIGMGQLYEQVFEKKWLHRQNDTRLLRILISDLRREGVSICSSYSSVNGGYWLAAAGNELAKYCRKIRGRAIGLLGMEAAIRKISLPELVGQLQLDLQGG